MTREERKKAIEVLDDMKVKIDIPKAAKTQNDRNWALDMAIKLLEQEPSEDMISREHLLSEIGELKQSPWFNRGKLYDIDNPDFQHAMYLERKETVEIIEDICIKKEPSVHPSRKGHWIPIPYQLDYGSDVKCSECGKEIIAGEDFKICPYCFADMRGDIK